MSGHALRDLKYKSAATAERLADGAAVAFPCREQLVARVEAIYALYRRGLWGVLLFLSLSALSLWLSQAGFSAAVQVEVEALVGPPPPVELLHVALGVSWLSAFVMILGRRGVDGSPGYSWWNISLPTAFYPLYLFVNPCGSEYLAVFAAGLLLLLLEHVMVARYARGELVKASALLRSMSR